MITSQNIPHLTLRHLEKRCSEAEAAYWKAASSLTEWQLWQKAKPCEQKERRQAFYRKADQLPEWMAYQATWLALKDRYSHKTKKEQNAFFAHNFVS